ncbi:MAG: CTP synthase [Microgenomates group bacterium]
MKYIFVSGGVISGIGKGLTSASVGLLLQNAGYTVTPIKCENYLNIDAGTINPIEHGDPFLCEDGTEADMDLGSYEKILGINMGKDNFMTVGQIYKTVIDRERRFEYHGEDVEAIPHITNEIIHRIQAAGKKHNSDIILVELGGTAGEYQNVFYYEASRILTLKHPGDVVHIHVSYVPRPSHLGEPKTKPTQLSVRTLNSMGIQPDFIIARSEQTLDQRRKDRFALFCNMHPEDIISNPDVKHVYEIPLILSEQHIEKRIMEKLGLEVKKSNLTDWKKLVDTIKAPKKKKVQIAIVGKYFGTGNYQLKDAYAALFDSIDHASWHAGAEIDLKIVSAEKVEKEGIEIIGHPDGIIVPIGWGDRGAEGMIQAASYARKNKIPYLGLCYGMQLAAVAFARDVLKMNDANTTENDPETKNPVIHIIENQKSLIAKRAYGGTMRLGGWEEKIRKGTLAYSIYGKESVVIRHRHRYEFNNKYAEEFEKNGMIISGRSKSENLVEVIELDQKLHPFYIGTQGHPEYSSSPLQPHPIFSAFVEACWKYKKA